MYHIIHAMLHLIHADVSLCLVSFVTCVCIIVPVENSVEKPVENSCVGF